MLTEKIKLENVLVVLNYNDAETTLEFVEMAKKCETIDRIVITDNCSTDDSYSKLCSLKSIMVDVIKTEKNGGYAYGNNFGCQYAIKKYSPNVLFISNPDVEFQDETLIKMEKVLGDNKNIGVVAPIVNQGYNVWNLPDFWGVIESIFLLWFNLDKKKIKKKLLNSDKEYEEIGVVEGSFFAISSDAYERVRGFDEKTFLYCEEIILARKLQSRGMKEVVLPKCRYNHYHSVSIKKHYGGKVRAFKNFHKSMLVYLQDYLKIGRIEKIIFEVSFALGYVERFVYDLYKKVKR